MLSIHKKTIEELKRRLISELGDRIDSIILYGSVARNEAREESDIDILVIIKDKDIKIYDKISKIRTDIDLDNNTLTSLVSLSRRELERYIKLGSPFIESVIEEGVILYDNGNFEKIRKSIVATS
ncbi:MAG: nucleotidyltransferase domain-containing protein [archaeon]|nr:nucleotidyltransferase domain-containing protein [archaeon]